MKSKGPCWGLDTAQYYMKDNGLSVCRQLSSGGGCGCHGSMVPGGTVSCGDDKAVDVGADDRNLEPHVRVVEGHLHCTVLAVLLENKE